MTTKVITYTRDDVLQIVEKYTSKKYGVDYYDITSEWEHDYEDGDHANMIKVDIGTEEDDIDEEGDSKFEIKDGPMPEFEEEEEEEEEETEKCDCCEHTVGWDFRTNSITGKPYKACKNCGHCTNV